MNERKRPYVSVYIGRDWYRGIGCAVAFNVFPRRDPPEGELAYSWNFRLTWNWPRIDWVRIKDEPANTEQVKS